MFFLFAAEGEKRWAPGWDYQEPAGNGAFGEDYIFLTGGHDHAAVRAVWLVKKFQPPFFAQYYKVEPGEKAGLISVALSGKDKVLTEVEVSYSYQALSPSCESFVSGFDADAYYDFISERQALPANYLNKNPGADSPFLNAGARLCVTQLCRKVPRCGS